MSRTKRLFTLLELLVTIAIITILSCLLLPGLQRAKSCAQQIACSGNLKQMTFACHSYAADFTNLPITWIGGDMYNDTNWLAQLQSYMGNNRLLICPAKPEQSYAPSYNLWMKTNYRYSLASGGAVGTEPWMYPAFPRNIPKRISKFLKPGETVLFVDGNNNLSSGAVDNYPFFFADYATEIARLRHKGTEVYGFLDSHTAALKLGNLTEAQFLPNYFSSYYSF